MIRLQGIGRTYHLGGAPVHALVDVSEHVRPGEHVAIMGPSGSGKSTLLNILGCLDRPTSGTYRVAGKNVSELDADALAALRREHFGFIFQRYHLLGDLSAAANVEIPAVYAGINARERRKRVNALLERLGVATRSGHRPNQLSGGQQQRVSIARALINGAEVILADEPTGALDRRSGEEVLKILKELHREGRTIIIVTHDADVAARAERIIELRDGRIASDRRTETAATAEPAATRSARDSAVGWFSAMGRLREASRMALAAMAAHRLRAFLTMLGIIIGIAAVSSVVALGNASQRKVLSDIANLGTNTIAPDLIEPVMYHSLPSSTRATALIRMRGHDPLQFASRLRDLTSTLDPTLRLQIVTFSEMKRQQMIGLRLMVLGSSLVIATALLLSAAGVYAMMSFTVSQRRKEIGIRAAMGADAGQLLRSIFTRAALQLAAGIVVGTVLALMIDRASDGEMLGSFGRALLPVTAVVMTIVGLFATIGPARRGLRIQPTEALRAE